MKSPGMTEFDRLTTLMERFTLRVQSADVASANLVVAGDEAGRPEKIWFGAAGVANDLANDLANGSLGGRVLFSASVDWGGVHNPLMAALPKRFGFELAGDMETIALVRLMCSETGAARCGSASVVNRLGEVLIVRLLRAQIEAGSTEAGLLAGLSDPKLSRALVAMHDQPGRAWRNEDLAGIAGHSRSRFAETFMATVGETPAAYLRRWRLTLARQDLHRGDRVDAVARRYGYGSAEGFARAFKSRFGGKPVKMRPNARHARAHQQSM